MDKDQLQIIGYLIGIAVFVMGFIWYILRRDFKHYDNWKDNFSAAVSKDITRSEHIIKNFMAETSQEFKWFQERYSKELVTLKDKFTSLHDKCRESIIAEQKKLGEDANIDQKELIKLNGTVRVLNEKIEKFEQFFYEARSVFENTATILHRLGKLEQEVDILIEKGRE